MAFSNKEVLEAVLRACEADADAREASLGLSGLPLDYVFRINPNFDYLKWMLYHLRSRHRVIDDAFARNNFSDIDIPSDIKWFIDFSLSMANLFDEYECLNKYALDESIQVSYFKESYDKRDQYTFIDCLARGRKFLSTDNNINTFVEVDDALFCYQECLLGALKFLAEGVTMDENTSREELDAWLALFSIFATVDPWDDIYKIADKSYPHSSFGFMKSVI